MSLLNVSEFGVKCHFPQITDTDLLHMGPVYTGAADGSCTANAPAHTHLHTQIHTHALKVLSCTPLKVSHCVCMFVCVFTPWHQSGYWLSLYRWDWLLHTLSTGRTHSTSNTSRAYTHTYICIEHTTSHETTRILYALHQTLKHASTLAHIHRYFHCALFFKEGKCEVFF